jgi:hypothetical protein
MDSVCAWRVLENTMKLVNRITLVTAHIVRATNMRMIICFMAFPLSSCEPLKAQLPLICVTPISTFLQNVRHVYRLLYSGTGCRFDFENQMDLGMTPLPQVHSGTQNVSHESLFTQKSDWRFSNRLLSIACAKSWTRAGEQRMDRYQFASGTMLEAG